eukprot:TRINITY_DN1826_c2_g1_i4.p1 TRINITY_DN1826_c2_g1~~TRINITY_DN1826_c2_g1_i4.p1  ORF type:complete len:454 (-),score=65.25 TRINITY_DN1826_c2_g1_i4:323-1684(-)
MTTMDMMSQEYDEPQIKVLVIYENVSKKVMKTLGGFLLNQIRTFAKENPINTVGGPCAGTFGFDGYQLDVEAFTFQDAPRKMECLMPLSDFFSTEFNISYEKECTVPKYDLLCTKEIESKSDVQRKGKKYQRRSGRRCFNCRSYNHTVDKCFHAVNKEEVKQNIRAFNEAKSGGIPNTGSPQVVVPPPPLPPIPPPITPNSRNPSRASTQDIKDVQPGKLSYELREGLGMGDSDPPPWLFRMRELGPPPAYRNQLTPIQIKDEIDRRIRPSSSSTTSAVEEGEIQSEEDEEDVEPCFKRQKLEQNFDDMQLDKQNSSDLNSSSHSSQILICYPGVNGSIPEGGDRLRWKDGGRTDYYRRLAQNSGKQLKSMKNSKSSDLSNCSTTIMVGPPMIPSGPIIQNGNYRCLSGVQPFPAFGEMTNGWCVGGGNRGFMNGRSEPLPQFNSQQQFFAPY